MDLLDVLDAVLALGAIVVAMAVLTAAGYVLLTA